MYFVFPPRLAFVLSLALFACTALAQQPPATRAGEIRAARERKQAEVRPETSPGFEQRLNLIKDKRLIERLTQGADGLTVVIGGLPTGQGFALGPQYSRADLAGGELQLRTSARGAASRAVLLDLELKASDLRDGRAFAGFLARHENAPRIDYFGSGPDSDRANRTHFRRELTSVGGEFGYKPVRRARLGAGVGSLLANTGPGNFARERPRTEDVFGFGEVAGLERQTDFLTADLFADYDWRDNPGGPRRGGYYVARYTYYDDRDLDVHNFRRLRLEAQHYVPFFNARRVVALRAATFLSFENGAGSTVPFYLQRVLGGSDDLRGFRQYRFYDNNEIVANIEYRWEAFTGLDMALFLDAGKVAPTPAQVNFHDLEASAGFGLRFNVRNSTFMRFDFGFSHEGLRVWFKFGNPF